MSLTTYEEVRPWARSIRTRVANREMPPWHLDKTVGIRHYKNDLSLNDDRHRHDRALGGRRRAGRQRQPTCRRRRRSRPKTPGTSASRISSCKMDGDAHDVRQGTGLVDRLLRRHRPDRRPLDQGDGNQARQPPHRAPRGRSMSIEPDAPAGTPEGGVKLHEYAVGKYGDTFDDEHRPPAEERHAASASTCTTSRSARS